MSIVITPGMLAAGANKQLEIYHKADPVDQVGKEKPFLNWLIAKKQEAPGGNFYFREKVRIGYDSNYQNYYGDDKVDYNRRDTIRWTSNPWSNFHDGFGLNEDELAQNGITMTDDVDAVTVSDAGMFQLYDILKENLEALKLGVQEEFNEEMLLNGAQNPKAAQGLDYLVSTTPSVGTVAGISAVNSTFWRNNVNLNLVAPTTAAQAETFLEQMELTWRACTLYGKTVPDKIVCGDKFYDAYKRALRLTQSIHVSVASGGGAKAVNSYEGATGDLFFHNVLVEWDPTFTDLETQYGPSTYPWDKRCYFLSSKTIKLRPLKGHWMVNRKPDRMYDRYVYYFAMTSKYRLTINKRNANAVLSIA